jgi:uncharacterized protein with PIN domain
MTGFKIDICTNCKEKAEGYTREYKFFNKTRKTHICFDCEKFMWQNAFKDLKKENER